MKNKNKSMWAIREKKNKATSMAADSTESVRNKSQIAHVCTPHMYSAQIQGSRLGMYVLQHT